MKCGLLDEKRNIVLVGMSRSGKSTLGRLLSDKLCRPLVDTDDVIIERTGMPITEIFATQGEARFRDLESEVVSDVCRMGGVVIATGGGAVLRPENVDAMKENGTVVFLDRPLETILPTDDRPLANTTEKVRRLYEERLPIYRAVGDVTVFVHGTPEETAEDILRKLRE